MSLLLSRFSRRFQPLCVRRLSLLPRPLLLLSNGFSTSSLLESPPCSIIGADKCGENLARLIISKATDGLTTTLDKQVPLELFDTDPTKKIGACHGWVATIKEEDGILRLQDDLNPYTSPDKDPKRIRLPPLVTLRHCQTQIITNVSMSTPCPEDKDCIVAVKFLGPQISFCKPGKSNPEWSNFNLKSKSFYSSHVMFSKKDYAFRLLGSGCGLIGSWGLRDYDDNQPKLQMLQQLKNLPEHREYFLNKFGTRECLVESQSTGETFIVRWYKNPSKDINGVAFNKTEGVMVFKLDEEGNLVYTQDIGDLSIFLSNSEAFCVTSSSFPGLLRNYVYTLDSEEMAYCNATGYPTISQPGSFKAPYHIPPPQTIQDY